jgi:hypothetical protein
LTSGSPSFGAWDEPWRILQKRQKKPPHAFARRGYLFGDCPTFPASRCGAVSANGLFQDDASARDTFLAQTIAVANITIKKRLLRISVAGST